MGGRRWPEGPDEDGSSQAKLTFQLTPSPAQRATSPPRGGEVSLVRVMSAKSKKSAAKSTSTRREKTRRTRLRSKSQLLTMKRALLE